MQGRAQAGFKFLLVFFIQMASRTLLFKQYSSDSRIFIPSQSTLCPSSHACTVTPFFWSLVFSHCTLVLRYFSQWPGYLFPINVEWITVLACNLIHNLLPVCLWCGSVDSHQELSEGFSQLENCLNSILPANFLRLGQDAGRISLGGLAVGGSSSESRAAHALGDLLRLGVMIPWGWLTHLKVSFRCVNSSFLLVSSQIVLTKLSLFPI